MTLQKRAVFRPLNPIYFVPLIPQTTKLLEELSIHVGVVFFMLRFELAIWQEFVNCFLQPVRLFAVANQNSLLRNVYLL